MKNYAGRNRFKRHKTLYGAKMSLAHGAKRCWPDWWGKRSRRTRRMWKRYRKDSTGAMLLPNLFTKAVIEYQLEKGPGIPLASDVDLIRIMSGIEQRCKWKGPSMVMHFQAMNLWLEYMRNQIGENG